MRYFTNGSNGYFNRHVLLDDASIREIIDNPRTDAYASVQSYDANGIEQWSQLVFDIDSKDMLEAYEIAKEISDDVEFEYDTDTQIWFSGSKGFHVITGLVYASSKANVTLRHIASQFSDKIDVSMYKIRSMFRLPNSINGKSGLHKIQVMYNESLPSIKQRAKTRQPYTLLELDTTNTKFLLDCEKFSKLQVTHTPKSVVIKNRDWYEAMPPCLKFLLENGSPIGTRWETCFALIRHWRLSGVSCEEAINIASNYDLFKVGDYTEGMIRSYYNREPMSFGCMTGNLSWLLQKHCHGSCEFSDLDYKDIVNNFERIT